MLEFTAPSRLRRLRLGLGRLKILSTSPSRATCRCWVLESLASPMFPCVPCDSCVPCAQCFPCPLCPLWHLKTMKYSAALPLCLVWREHFYGFRCTVMGFACDNMRGFFLTLRKSKDVIFLEHKKSKHKVMLFLCRK